MNKPLFLYQYSSYYLSLFNLRLLDLLVNHIMIELSERFYELVTEEDEESISDVNWQGYDALAKYHSDEVNA